MIEIQGTIFKCEHCGKRQFRKCDMTLHERWCKKNPNNQHMCLKFCTHLEKTEEEYQGYEFISKRTVFKCGLTGQQMFSFVAERRKLPVVTNPDAIRMPLECDKYRDMHQHFDDYYIGEDLF